MKNFILKTVFISALALETITLVACGGGSSGGTPNPTSSLSNTAKAGSFAYINNVKKIAESTFTEQLTICKIDQNQLTDCKDQNIYTFGNILFVNNNKTAIFGQESKISSCDVNQADGTLQNCSTVTSASVEFQHNVAILGTESQFIYVADGPFTNNPRVYPCTISPSYKALSCNILPNKLTKSISMIIDSQASRAYAVYGYASDATVFVCNIDKDSGNISGCTSAIDNSNSRTFVYPLGLTMDPSGKYIYVISTGEGYGTATVSVCNIDQDSGKFISCNKTGSGFSYSYNLILDPTGLYAFVTNSDKSLNSISTCIRNPTTGALSNCTDTKVKLSAPVWLSTF